MNNMLIQLHHQNKKTGRTVFIAQREIENYKEMRCFLDEIVPKYPINKTDDWMACNEESEYFMKTVSV